MIGAGCDRNGEGRDGCGRSWCRECYDQPWEPPKALPAKPEIELAPKDENTSETIERLLARIEVLEHEVRGAAERYRQLQEIYTKLADVWNVFQVTAKPTNRNVHRAEAVGEMVRLLTNVLIRSAWGEEFVPGTLCPHCGLSGNLHAEGCSNGAKYDAER